MSVSKTTTKFGLPLPQPGDIPDWYDLGAASQKLDDLAGATNGIATLDTDGNAAQMSAAAVPKTRKIAGLDLTKDRTLAELIAAGLCPAPTDWFSWTPYLYGTIVAGTPTYASQVGYYRKIGPLVCVKFQVEITAKGGMTGSICVGGLPFEPSDWCCNFLSSTGYNFSESGPNLYIADANGAGLLDTNISDSFSIWAASGFYMTA